MKLQSDSRSSGGTTWPPRRNETASEVSTWVPGNQYQHRSAPGWEWTRPSAPGGHGVRATTRVAVAALSSVSATDFTRTVAPSTEPSRHPRRSVGLAANAARTARATGASSRRGTTASADPDTRLKSTAVMVDVIAPPFSPLPSPLHALVRAHVTRPKLRRGGQRPSNVELSGVNRLGRKVFVELTSRACTLLEHCSPRPSLGRVTGHDPSAPLRRCPTKETTMSQKALFFALGALALAGCDNPTAPVTARPEAMAIGFQFPPVLRPVARIVFTSDRSGAPGYKEIYSMNPDGTGIVRLTNSPGYDGEPAGSPDGHKVAFASFRTGTYCCGVYVMSAIDGSGVVRLNDGRAPAWSPDGSKIAFTRYNSTGDDIYVMNAADGSGVVRLTTTAGNDNQPVWSPDGSKIAFSSGRDGFHNIYTMNAADGSGVVRLTMDSAWTGDPAWSPDGSKIAFSSNVAPPWNSQIYVMNADGSGRHCLSNNTFWDTEPTWSPDGSKIAFTSTRDDPNGELYVMSA